MDALGYYLWWLLAGLLVIAVFCQRVARARWHQRRCEQAPALTDVLARYSLWVAAQRLRLGQQVQHEVALEEAGELQQRWFPELEKTFQALREADARLHDFLRRQQHDRESDAEAWLESDSDGQYLRLWDDHQAVLDLLAAQLQSLCQPQEGALRSVE